MLKNKVSQAFSGFHNISWLKKGNTIYMVSTNERSMPLDPIKRKYHFRLCVCVSVNIYNKLSIVQFYQHAQERDIRKEITFLVLQQHAYLRSISHAVIYSHQPARQIHSKHTWHNTTINNNKISYFIHNLCRHFDFHTIFNPLILFSVVPDAFITVCLLLEYFVHDFLRISMMCFCRRIKHEHFSQLSMFMLSSV